MEKFNLKKAKAGHPVICRNGKKARIICFDQLKRIKGRYSRTIESEKRVLTVLVKNDRFGEILRFYNFDGTQYCRNAPSADLLMADFEKPKKNRIKIFGDLFTLN